MNSAELREKYLSFFESKGCQRWPSSSLVPDDPSMLLTSAGMVQFKPWFLQQKQLDEQYVGTTTVQKCVRTTDIDVIGTDARHLSFFEMLGNFSFGAYFKQEMCEWALEFSLDVLGFDLDRLYFTIFEDDDETMEIWKSLGIPADRIFKLGEDDNFWRAGPTGPCGPCSELYYDLGEEFGCDNPDCAPGCDCDRYLEYWNCVFTQFDGQEDGTLVALPKNNIDTGMGLERTLVILNNLDSVFQTDVLRALIAVSEKLSGLTYGESEQNDTSMRIIADHIRSCTFMIGDGILPGNDGRGYVLRRLLRRAMRHGHLLGIEAPFLFNAVRVVVDMMGDVYVETKENQTLIERVIIAEEERFAQTLKLGQSYLDNHLDELAAGAALPGETAFELHDRYGFPIELTTEIAAEQGFTVDREGFEAAMAEQRQRARDAVKGEAWANTDNIFNQIAATHGATEFVGYDQPEANATVLAIIIEQDEKALSVHKISAGQTAQVVLNVSPFYAEMGGQLGDTGSLTTLTGTEFTVTDTHAYEHIYAHQGVVQGDLQVGDQLLASIDRKRRQRIERNHTATHLLHYALRQVVGDHVHQAGSLVAPDRLRFDFTHFSQLSKEQLDAVETLANQLVIADSPVSASYANLDDARAEGVIALFGEKYDDIVRVLTAGEESKELCGGTHVSHTAQIGLIKIVSEGSVGASLRRIEAVTSYDAFELVKRTEQQLEAVATALNARPSELLERIEALQQRVRELESKERADRRQTLAQNADELLQARLTDAAFTTVVTRYDGLPVEEMRSLWDLLRDILSRDINYDGKAALVVGGITAEGTPLLIAAATEAAVADGFDANSLIRQIAPLIGGGGGGRASMAQAGGKDVAGLDTALDKARELLG
ncbi:MAG: alanine--tRNA ligase [Coriobacteriia bacterium]|nr:alanine--tRNA ligase [Coriobacteriia bacterium]